MHINIEFGFSLELRYILSIADSSDFSAASNRTGLTCTIQTTTSYNDNSPFLSTGKLRYCFELALGDCWTNPLASHECGLKAMYANLTGHSVQQVQALYSIVVRWQMYVQDQGKLSKCGQDDLLL